MSEEDAFLTTILTTPDDDTARLVYADWLDEHGEYAKAAYLREVVAMAAHGGPGNIAVWNMRVSRLRSMRDPIDPNWLRRVDCPRFTALIPPPRVVPPPPPPHFDSSHLNSTDPAYVQARIDAMVERAKQKVAAGSRLNMAELFYLQCATREQASASPKSQEEHR